MQGLCDSVSDIVGERVTLGTIRQKFIGFVSALRQEHEFLLYFNPARSPLIIDAGLVSNLSMLVATYCIR